jgi:hypothetical protein
MDFGAASVRVSAFLSDSRLLAEKARRCKHSNCAFLCTGIQPEHCCRLCARSPGQHGPKCERKLLPCSSAGCKYAVTGLSAAHCCRMCAAGRGEHGPNCWHLDAAGDARADDAEPDELCGSAAGDGEAPRLDGKGGDGMSEELEETEEERALRLELEAKIAVNADAIRANEQLIQMLRSQVHGG